MASNDKKISLIVQVLDKVAEPIRAINKRIASIVAPARAASRAMNGLMAESGLKRVAAAAGNVGKQFGQLRSTVGGILGVIGAATGALGGLFYALKRNADAGDQAVKAAQRYGMSVSEWQRVAYAGDLANVSVQDLGASLRGLNKNAVAAATGNKGMALWFQRAGVSATDMHGKVRPANALLEELADKFAAMPDGPKKTALAMGLMSEVGEKMIPLLNGGAKALREAGKEAEALGLVNAQLAADSEAFNDNLTRVQRALQGVFNTVSAAVLPVLNEILPLVKDWIVANRELIGVKVREFMEGFKASLPALIQGIKDTFSAIATVARAVNGVVQFFGGWKNVITAIAAFMAAKLVLSIFAVTKAIVMLGAAILTTPIGWLLAGIAALATAGYLIIKHWQPIKDFFIDLVKNTLAPFVWIMEKIVSLLPESVRAAGTALGQRVASTVGTATVPSAVAAGAGSAQVNGQVTVKVETGAGVRARVTDQRASGGIDLGVETGYAMAGAA